MMKILLITPDGTDALAYYRSSLPLSFMRKSHAMDFAIDHTVNWASLRQFDLIFMHRPYTGLHLEVVQKAKEWGVKVVSDFDDWLFDLPTSNKAKFHFDSYKDTFTRICNLSDGIITATDYLGTKVKELLLDQSKPMLTAPNAYAKPLYPYAEEIRERNKIVLWRGSDTHNDDLLSVKDDFQELFKKHSDWDFAFMASFPWVLEPIPDNVKIATPITDLHKYFKGIYTSCPAIMTHPLRDNAFNRSKSMCSWLEATHAKAAFVGPDFEEFNRAGITNYNADKSFFECIDELITKPELIAENYAKSANNINENLLIDHVNKKRFAFFEKLLNL